MNRFSVVYHLLSGPRTMHRLLTMFKSPIWVKSTSLKKETFRYSYILLQIWNSHIPQQWDLFQHRNGSGKLHSVHNQYSDYSLRLSCLHPELKWSLCSVFRMTTTNIHLIMSAYFAIKQINRNTHVLPNISLILMGNCVKKSSAKN